jgi:hypothetical protein
VIRLKFWKIIPTEHSPAPNATDTRSSATTVVCPIR